MRLIEREFEPAALDVALVLTAEPFKALRDSHAELATSGLGPRQDADLESCGLAVVDEAILDTIHGGPLR